MENIELKVGQTAPDFTIMASDKSEHKLSDFKGKKVILYFYPKDNTPGCSIEAQEFAANNSSFEEKNAVILGISRDSLASHDKFIAKFGLPFLLLSDTDEAVCKLYDVIKEKNMYGKKVWGIERSTFIIDENGILEKIYRKVKVTGHVEDVLKSI